MVSRRPHPTHTLDRFRPRRVTVEGQSMAATLLPGDRLVVIPAVKWKKGDLVAARDPRRPERLIVKRLHSLNDEGFDLRGDNPAASTDSRHFGPVPRSLVLGKAVYRYAPAPRAGWINRAR